MPTGLSLILHWIQNAMHLRISYSYQTRYRANKPSIRNYVFLLRFSCKMFFNAHHEKDMPPLPLFVNFNVFKVLVRIYMVNHNQTRYEITCLRILGTVEFFVLFD